jgi:hypothetical protein
MHVPKKKVLGLLYTVLSKNEIPIIATSCAIACIIFSLRTFGEHLCKYQQMLNKVRDNKVRDNCLLEISG